MTPDPRRSPPDDAGGKPRLTAPYHLRSYAGQFLSFGIIGHTHINSLREPPIAQNHQPIRSLHIVPRLVAELGGSITAALEMCHNLIEAGHPAQVLSSHDPRDDLRYLGTSYPDISVLTLPRRFPSRYSNVTGLRRILVSRRSEIDIVSIHTIFSALTWRAALACDAAKIPYVLHPHGSLDPFDLKKHAVAKAMLGPLITKRVISGARALVLTTQRESDAIVDYGAGVERHAVPLPVSVPDRTGDGAQFRMRFGIAPEAKVVLFLSRLDEKKGLDLLIPAIVRLTTRFPDLRLVIAGAGDRRFSDWLQRFIERNGAGHVATCVGFVAGPDKADAFAAADLFALPSRNENFGIVVVEAMHAGVPVLISDNVYLSGDLEAAEAVRVCAAEGESVEMAIGYLLDNESERMRLASAGRDVAHRHFNPAAATRKLIDVYRCVLGRP